jgi:hypothetical protein
MRKVHALAEIAGLRLSPTAQTMQTQRGNNKSEPLPRGDFHSTQTRSGTLRL